MQLLIFVDIVQVLKIWISEVQDFGNFELSPMNIFYYKKDCDSRDQLM